MRTCVFVVGLVFFFNDIFIQSTKDFQKGSSQPFILSFLEPINNSAQDQNHFSISMWF